MTTAHKTNITPQLKSNMCRLFVTSTKPAAAYYWLHNAPPGGDKTDN